MHGTAYVNQHLRGRVTGCYVDQQMLSEKEDAPVTSYYIWLPYLLSIHAGPTHQYRYLALGPLHIMIMYLFANL